MSTVHLLVSPEARRASTAVSAAAVMTAIRSAGSEPADITADGADESAAAVHAAVAAGAERVVVVGGDGLVHLALQAVAGTGTVLGIVPVGTGNDFARALGLDKPESIEAATRRALGPAATLDAISTDHGWVASVATAGFSGDVNSRANRLRWPRGPKRYTVATLLEIPRLRRRTVRLIVGDQAHDLDIAMLAVANTAWFGGGMEICPSADPTDGLLDVTVVSAIGRISLLRFFPRVFSGDHLDHPAVSIHRGPTIRLESDGLDVWGDGEPLGSGSITFTAVPGALHLAR